MVCRLRIAIFGRGLRLPQLSNRPSYVAEIIAVDIDGLPFTSVEGAVGLGEQINADMQALLLKKQIVAVKAP